VADLHERLLTKLDQAYEIWAPRNVSPVLFDIRRALRAVVELHKPTTFLRSPLATPICDTCSTDDDAHDVLWPCSTIQAIARELGVDRG
jgi:hypothetical protein